MFIDDVHPESQEATSIVPVNILCSAVKGIVSEEVLWVIEQANKNSKVTLDVPITELLPNFIVLESQMREYAIKTIEILEWLSRKKRYKFREWKGWFCSEQKLLDANWVPTCIGYDVWLTYFKDTVLWFDWWINILSEVYQEQQSWVTRVYQKVNPDFKLWQLYY